MSHSLNIPEEFTFQWKVTNFDACFLHNHESFDSPSFSLKNFCNTRWYLRLSLESHRKYGFEYVCALVREYDEGPKSVGIHCRVSLDSEILAEGYQTFTKGSKYDFPVPDLYDFDKFPQMISLIFKCEMYFNFREEMLAGHCSVPNCLQSCCQKSDLSEVTRGSLAASFRATDERLHTHPKQGFAFSRYLVERRILTLPVHDFILNVEEKTQKIATTSFTDTPSISVEFSTVSEDDCDYLKVNFLLVEAKLKSNLLLYSEVSFVDSNLKTVDSGRDYHLFRRNHADEIWSFGHFFDWDQIKLHACDCNDLHLKCQLFFFDGQLQSEILWTADFGRLASKFSDKKTLAKEKGVETVPQTKYSAMDAEKEQRNISQLFLSSSPSFGKKTVHECLNSETVNKKIKIEHSNCLEQTEFDNIVHIYSTPEKFQMMPCNNENRKSLEENLDVSNFCTALILANTRKDKKLYNSVVEFILIHKNKILKSNSWERFAEKNDKLATKILTEVCIRLPEKIIE